MNKVKFLTFTVVILIILNVTMMTFLWLRKPPARQGPDRIIIERLELRTEQVEEFEKLKQAHRSQVRIFHDSIRMLKTIFFDGLRTEHPDLAQAEHHAAKISRLQKKIEMATFLHFQSLRQLCDDRQKPLFDEFIQEIARALGRGPGPPEKNSP
ncbi:MAG: hypothetical protein ACOYXT_01075 [Bacteroidota bacterium]